MNISALFFLQNDECVSTSASLLWKWCMYQYFRPFSSKMVTVSILPILFFFSKMTTVSMLPPLFLPNDECMNTSAAFSPLFLQKRWMYYYIRPFFSENDECIDTTALFFFENDEWINTPAPFSSKMTNASILPPLFPRKWWMYQCSCPCLFENDECINPSAPFCSKMTNALILQPFLLRKWPMYPCFRHFFPKLRMYQHFRLFSVKMTNISMRPLVFLWKWWMYEDFRPFSSKIMNVLILPLLSFFFF